MTYLKYFLLGLLSAALILAAAVYVALGQKPTKDGSTTRSAGTPKTLKPDGDTGPEPPPLPPKVPAKVFKAFFPEGIETTYPDYEVDKHEENGPRTWIRRIYMDNNYAATKKYLCVKLTFDDDAKPAEKRHQEMLGRYRNPKDSLYWYKPEEIKVGEFPGLELIGGGRDADKPPVEHHVVVYAGKCLVEIIATKYAPQPNEEVLKLLRSVAERMDLVGLTKLPGVLPAPPPDIKPPGSTAPATDTKPADIPPPAKTETAAPPASKGPAEE
jgi:hypothetical protein